MGMLCRTVALLGLCGAVVGFALKFTPAVSIINAWGQPFVHAQASSMACGLVLAAAALACEEMLAPGRRKGRASSRPKLRRAANALYVRRVGLLGGAIVAGACVIWAVLTWSFLRRMACDSGEACWHTVARVVSMRAGNAALLPLALLGVPLSKSSALWRAFGQPFEEAVALHRLLGHAAMGLLSFHALGYLVVWTLESSLLEEITVCAPPAPPLSLLPYSPSSTSPLLCPHRRSRTPPTLPPPAFARTGLVRLRPVQSHQQQRRPHRVAGRRRPLGDVR